MSDLAARLLAAVQRCRCGGYPPQEPLRYTYTDPTDGTRKRGAHAAPAPCTACAGDLAALGVTVDQTLFGAA